LDSTSHPMSDDLAHVSRCVRSRKTGVGSLTHQKRPRCGPRGRLMRRVIKLAIDTLCCRNGCVIHRTLIKSTKIILWKVTLVKVIAPRRRYPHPNSFPFRKGPFSSRPASKPRAYRRWEPIYPSRDSTPLHNANHRTGIHLQ